MKRQSLEYSSSSSPSSSSKISNQKSLHSKEYLQRNQNFQIQLSKASILDTLVKPKQLTYLDNQRLYGIVKVQDYLQLKQKLRQIMDSFQKSVRENEQRLLQMASFEGIVKSLQRQNLQKKNIIETLNKAITEQNNQISCLSIQLKQTNSKLITKNYQTVNFSDIFNRDWPSKRPIMDSIQVQTQYIIPQIVIAPYQQKSSLASDMVQQNQLKKNSLDQPTLKQIIEQSLQIFTKELTNQAQFIKEQVLQMKQLKNQNIQLRDQNGFLRQKLNEVDIDEQKLQIFKDGLSRFLNRTQDNIKDSLKKGQNRQGRNEQQGRKVGQVQVGELEGQGQLNQERLEQHIIESQVEHHYSQIVLLKKQNLSLLKMLGEERNRQKRIQKIIEDSQEIADDGVVGQLVKMSKLVKESIVSILKEV